MTMDPQSIKKSIDEIEQNLRILKVEVSSLEKDNNSLLEENKKLKRKLGQQ